jgi:hypothetical protein
LARVFVNDHRARCEVLIAVIPIGVLVVHSLLYWRGLMASNGELRYMLTVAPFWGRAVDPRLGMGRRATAGAPPARVGGRGGGRRAGVGQPILYKVFPPEARRKLANRRRGRGVG